MHKERGYMKLQKVLSIPRIKLSTGMPKGGDGVEGHIKKYHMYPPYVPYVYCMR